MKKQRILSLVLCVAMIFSMFTFTVSANEQTEIQTTSTTVDPLDFSAFEDYGVYVYAGNDTTADTESGMYALSFDDARSYDNRIYHYLDDKAYIEETIKTDTNLAGAYQNLLDLNAAGGDYKYLTRTVDGAWDYRNIGGKDAFWTQVNVRNRSKVGEKTPGGAMYFGLTNDVINETTSNLTFLVEYYDNTTSGITFGYCNTSFVNDGNASTSAFALPRTGTNTWKVGKFQVTDAKMDKDWNKTALGNNYASIKIQGPGNDYYISKILVIPTNTYNNILNPGQDPSEELANHNDGIDWWGLVKEKGVYTDAANPDAGTGIKAHVSNKLLDLNNASDVAEIGDTKINGKTVAEIKSAGFSYATLSGSDSAAKLSTATSADRVSKNTFFTTKNYRNATKYNIPGYLYFAVTSDIANAEDVYVVMEYLDYDPNMSTTQNSNGTYYENQTNITPVFAVKPKGATGYPSFNRHNTNTWKTVAIPVSNADLNSLNTATGLSNNEYDIRICGNGVPMHISRIGVVKASDVGIGTHKYHAPEKSGDGPTIWLAGDSIVEQLDVVNAYPRTGWGMELGNYFKKETIADSAPYTFDADGLRVTTKRTEGVTIVNRAKGGKSTRTFLNQVDPTAGPSATDTRWNDIKNGAKKGDYLFVSFCINDVGNRTTVQTNPYLVGDTGDRFSHRANIKEFKDECDKLGINLVLLTPAVGRGLGAGQDAHIASVHAQARELGVPVVDVRTYHKALVQSLKDANDISVYSTDKSKLVYNYILDKNINPEYNSGLKYVDDTHINQKGAGEIAKIICQEIIRKSDDFASMKALSSWIDMSKDITTMAAPAHQESDVNFEIADATYIVDGTASMDYREGDLQYKATVTNTAATQNDAIIYLALYDGNNMISKVVKSDKVVLDAGKSATITTPVLKVPDLDGYRVRKFIWNSKMIPYSSQNSIVLTADGANRRANLEWTLSKDYGDVTFDIYRDDLLIASTSKGAYVDEDAERGEHKYQINVVRDGEVIDQSAYALATVTNLYDVKQDGVFYAKASINSMNNIDDRTNGIYVMTGDIPYYPQDAIKGLNLTQADLDASYGTGKDLFQGAPLITNGGDGSHRTEIVSDKYGNTRTAWMFASMYRPSRKAAIESYMYIDESNTSNFTTADTQMSVYLEFLGNKNAPEITYFISEKDDKGNYKSKNLKATAYSDSTTGDWKIARYDISDAYFSETTTYQGNAIMRISSGWGTPLYVSSITIIKGDPATASAKFAKLNNLEFDDRKVRRGNELYPDGVSADFSSGTPVYNGINIAYSTGGTSDNTAEIAVAKDGTGYYGTGQVVLDGGSRKQTYLYFKPDKDYLMAGGDKLVVDMTVKADYDMTITVLMPSYNKKTGVASAGNTNRAVATIKKDLVNNWQDIQFVIDDPLFTYLDNNGCGLRISCTQNAQDKDMQLRVSKISIKNLSGKNVEIKDGKQQIEGHTLHIAADSIAANYSAAQTEKNGIMGWGMVIGDYLTSDISINNRATAGASTVTFGNMGGILNRAKEGDYVLISFAHNDQMSNKWVPVEDYKNNLKNWIEQIRNKKAVPVLVTCIPQGKASTGSLVVSDSLQERRDAVAQVSQEKGVMLVKLGEQMFADEAAGMFTAADYVKMYCDEGYDNRTHVTESGARYIAQIIVNSMAKQSSYFAQYVK